MIQERRRYSFRLVVPELSHPFMEAYFYAEPVNEETQDKTYTLSRLEIQKFLSSQSIIFGIQETTVLKIIKQGYATHELIAQGIWPRLGTDTRFKVLVQHKQRQYESLFSQATFQFDDKLLERLRTFMVLPNTPLVRKIPPTRGAPGCDIRGVLIPGQKGNDKPFPPFRHVSISQEDACLLVSNIEGIPAIDLRHRIEVISLTILNRDVKESAFYKGTVVIVGNILDLVRVRAQADIIVLGTVDAAVLLAGRHIFIQNGVKGKDTAVLKSQGNIALRFAERMTIEAGLNIYSESLHHCYVVALGQITAKYILGGEVLASVAIWAEVAGSIGIDSLLSTGQNAYLETEIKSVQKNIADLQDKKAQIRQELSSKDLLSSKQKDVIRLHYRNKLLQLEYQLDRLIQRATQLKDFFELSRQAFIHIQACIYPDTSLRIHGFEAINYDFIDHKTRFIAGRYGIIWDKIESMSGNQS